MGKQGSFTLIAKTIQGLEQVLASELVVLGARDVKIINRAVAFEGDTDLMYRANHQCRTALRILKPLFSFTVREQQDLYQNIYGFQWTGMLDAEQTLAIDAVISYSAFTNSQFVAQRSKDAIVDSIRDKTGRRPSVNLEDPDLRINVHLFKDLCTVSLDSSGQSLHRRGYRKNTGPAPVNEVLAAGLIQLSGWDLTTPLYDPMCGSGTILAEAAMLAKNIPSGHFRSDYGFMRWKDFDKERWTKVVEEAKARISTADIRFAGSDRSEKAIAAARANLVDAGLGNGIHLEIISFEESVPPFESGTIICNPPYDERLKLDDSIAFYRMIGDTLKRKYTGYTAWFISSYLEALKFIGLRPSRRITVFNGPLECRFVKFDLYQGKKGDN